MIDNKILALKYRPQEFKDLIGQDVMVETVTNAIKLGKTPNAYLLTGIRGVGKTTCARILAKNINTTETETENKSDDFSYNIFELDAASNNGVDDIRNLIDQVRIPPQTGKYKVYIIDEVHMLSGQAFNAFLKTLEEPPSYAIFILATTEKHKVIPTILSRCQIYDFKKISTNEIQTYLEKIAKSEKIKYEDEAIFLIAKKSDGALRDALSIFDRLVNYTEGNITKELAYENLNVLDFEIYFKAYEYIINNDITNILLLLNLVIEKGFDAQHFIDGLSSHLRDLMVSKNSQTHILLEQNNSISKKYIEQSKIKDIDFILKAIDLSEDCSYRYKTSKNQRLLVEICLMKLCSISKMELKKKIKIIPSNSIKNNKDLIKEENKIVIKETFPNKKNSIEEEEEEDIPKIKNDKAISGLSISSLKIKKKIEKNREKELVNTKDQNEEFSEEELSKLWVKYYSNLLENGEKNLASILQIDEPILKNKHEIHFTLSNNTNKLELEKNKNKLLVFLKEKLNNNLIELIIHVNKEKEKEFVYSTTEKFEKLKSINPSIEKMRKEFKLGF